MINYLLVAIGGAVGAMLRFGVGRLVGVVWPVSFPVATLGINILGSVAMGLLMARAPAVDWWGRPLLAVGVLGGFTTFSAFGAESIFLFRRGESLLAGTYIIASVAGGLILAWVGERIASALFR
jgi:CrcB protein